MDSFKIWHRVTDRLRFFQKQGNGTPWHAKVCEESALLNVPESVIRQTLISLAQRGLVNLTTWSNTLRREAHYWEFPTPDAFFYNRDDGNYVRVKLLSASQL